MKHLLPVHFFSKQHFAVFRNVCPFVFHQTWIFFFFKCLSILFLKLNFSKLHFVFFEMFVRLFFPKTTFVCISKFLSARLYTYINKCVLKKHTITKYLMQMLVPGFWQKRFSCKFWAGLHQIAMSKIQIWMFVSQREICKYSCSCSVKIQCCACVFRYSSRWIWKPPSKLLQLFQNLVGTEGMCDPKYLMCDGNWL